MKEPKYPKTPMRNCMYCKHYNQKSNTCTAPRAEDIANFHPNEESDCPKLKYLKTENPKQNPQSFVEEFCIGKKCPFYYATFDLCTRPNLCPYSEENNQSRFKKLEFDKDI